MNHSETITPCACALDCHDSCMSHRDVRGHLVKETITKKQTDVTQRKKHSPCPTKKNYIHNADILKLSFHARAHWKLMTIVSAVYHMTHMNHVNRMNHVVIVIFIVIVLGIVIVVIIEIIFVLNVILVIVVVIIIVIVVVVVGESCASSSSSSSWGRGGEVS